MQNDHLPIHSPGSLVHRRKPKRFTRGMQLQGNLIGVGGLLAPALPAIVVCALGAWTPAEWIALVPVMYLSQWSVWDGLVLWGNRRLREGAYEELEAQRPDLLSVVVGFVGLSSSEYVHSGNHLDTHEDVGMLCATAEALVFYGDGLYLTLPRASIRRFGTWKEANYPGLWSDWIEIVSEETDGSQSIFYVQSREMNRPSQRTRYNATLLERLRGWLG